MNWTRIMHNNNCRWIQTINGKWKLQFRFFIYSIIYLLQLYCLFPLALSLLIWKIPSHVVTDFIISPSSLIDNISRPWFHRKLTKDVPIFYSPCRFAQCFIQPLSAYYNFGFLVVSRCVSFLRCIPKYEYHKSWHELSSSW